MLCDQVNDNGVDVTLNRFDVGRVTTLVLQLFPENDIRDNLRLVGKTMRSDDIGWQRHLDKFVQEQSAAVRLRNFMRRYSQAFVFLYDRWSILQFRFRSPASKENHYRSIPGRPWWLETSLKSYYPELEEAWQLVESGIRELRDECRKRGTPFYVYTIPAKYELGDQMARSTLRNTGADANLYDFCTNWRRTREILERLDVPYMDMRGGFLRTARPERYYWKEDAHLNAAGYLLVAQLLKPTAWKEYCRWAERQRKTARTSETQP
jgi:hypothetical protein